MAQEFDAFILGRGKRENEMSDQCVHCQVRGDVQKCRTTECSLRESWIVMELEAELARCINVERREKNGQHGIDTTE